MGTLLKFGLSEFTPDYKSTKQMGISRFYLENEILYLELDTIVSDPEVHYYLLCYVRIDFKKFEILDVAYDKQDLIFNGAYENILLPYLFEKDLIERIRQKEISYYFSTDNDVSVKILYDKWYNKSLPIKNIKEI